ncbi:hypothetical protein ACJ73_09992 [Blastomyces percursus]|uniref:Uncharacterized protein n=1 Tax=Blastomyces percursus TaxID=1658174 RepID=A0A1J9P2A9_9EURO|nr:hypothetical protein ACJ73_09992 [Blastomyces percursus]
MAGSDVDYSFRNSDQEMSSLNIRDILQMLGKEFQKEYHVVVQKELNNCVLGLQKILSFHKNGDTSFFADDKFSALEKRLLDLEKEAEQHAAPTKPSFSKPSYSDALKANITEAPERLAKIVKSQSTPPPPTQKIHDKAFLVRNRINDAFINANLTNKRVISCVSRSFKEYSVILMTTEDFSAEYLQEHNKLWQTVLSDTMDFDCNLEPSKFHKDEHWGSFVVHGLLTEMFNIDNGLEMLKEEFETNSHLLKRTPQWLSSGDNRAVKKHASAVFHVENTTIAKSLKTVNIAGQIMGPGSSLPSIELSLLNNFIAPPPFGPGH